MPKINILAISPDNYGVGKYRIIDPFTYISNTFNDEINVDITYDAPYNDKYFDNYDIVVFHSFIHKINHEVNMKRIEFLKNKGVTTIMDNDDYWAVDSRHPLFQQTSKNGYAEKKIELMKSVDYVTTTTPVYADSIKNKLGIKNVEVFPNAIDNNSAQFTPNPINSDKLRYGWLGGSSHLHDLTIMESAIGIMHDTYKDNIQFVLCGFDLRGSISELDARTNKVTTRPLKPQESVWYNYEQIFTKKYNAITTDYKDYLLKFTSTPTELSKWDNESYVRKWTRDINTYGLNYNYMDISLAPLIDSTFNNHKSQLKIIEAGFHKKAVIASDVNPYKIDLIDGKNALLVDPNKNHKMWLKQMKKLYNDRQLVKDLGDALYETVKDKYSLQKVSKDRVEFFKTIVNK